MKATRALAALPALRVRRAPCAPLRAAFHDQTDNNHVLVEHVDSLQRAYAVGAGATLGQAVKSLVSNRVGVLMACSDNGQVQGTFTARDILRHMTQFPDKNQALNTPVHEIMTPACNMCYCSPSDSLKRVRLLMRVLGVRNLPVIDSGVVQGIITAKIVTDHVANFNAEEMGGKEGFMRNIVGRKGLPAHTKITGTKCAGTTTQASAYEPELDQDASLARLRHKTLDMKAGVCALPHPFKNADGVSNTHRDFGSGHEASTDVSLSEDAHFYARLFWPAWEGDGSAGAESKYVTYVGVADGVGSWRQYGIDPRNYSQRLMNSASQFVHGEAPQRTQHGTAVSKRPARPIDVLIHAWRSTQREKVVGSCTACVVSLDHELNQLTYANVGDSGLMVMRHIDGDVTGSVFRKGPGEVNDGSTLRTTFLSQQQLRSFNLPYQLGFDDQEEEVDPGQGGRFETPMDANVTGYAVRPGDLVVVATDGLFDNVELDEILSLSVAWEAEWFGGPNKGRRLDQPGAEAQAMEDLARRLCFRARELSLDQTRDSPFAILAKENDIMWGGGMPDDCTVLTLRVTEFRNKEA